MNESETSTADESAAAAEDPSSRPRAGGSKTGRLMSLDALRGFDMFWIVGGEELLRAVARLSGNEGFQAVVVRQTTHVGWSGYVAYDLIFPLFMFLSGATLPMSISRRLEAGVGRLTLFWRLFRRMLLLVVLGMSHDLLAFDPDGFRPLSVLGLIGVAYFIAGLVVLFRGPRGQVAWAIGILVGYCAALHFIPVPGLGAGQITPGGVLNGFIDRNLLPGTLYQGVFDPEGVLNFLPAAALALIGAAAGRILTNAESSASRRVLWLLAGSAACLAAGHLWAVWFPIIKAIWSSSFVLVAAGWSLLLLALFHLIIDVWRIRWPFWLFVPIGMNAITIYVGAGYIDFAYSAEKLFGGLAGRFGELQADVILAAGVLVVEWLFLYFLYRKNVFLRA